MMLMTTSVEKVIWWCFSLGWNAGLPWTLFVNITTRKFISRSFHFPDFLLTKEGPNIVSCLVPKLKQLLLLFPRSSESLSLSHKKIGADIPWVRSPLLKIPSLNFWPAEINVTDICLDFLISFFFFKKWVACSFNFSSDQPLQGKEWWW